MTTFDELQRRYSNMIPTYAYVAVGPAWIDLLGKLCADLAATSGPLPRLIEAKQKFRELHLSFDEANEQHDELIRACERKADTICPFCGDLPAITNDCGYCRLGPQ